MIQQSIFTEWRYPPAMPLPGQQVVIVYEREDGTPSDYVVSTPIHLNGSHIRGGESIYRPLIKWLPIPE